MIWRVINSPMTKWTFYKYSDLFWLPENNLVGTPYNSLFGDTKRFLGECWFSAVCLGLLFQAADSSFTYSVFPLMQNSTPISPFHNGAESFL